ncbi:hypothetical protein INR49_012772 [Caranx melampygus]|nr:hypothetical protein INR49_012772 [Caranx melampygus]
MNNPCNDDQVVEEWGGHTDLVNPKKSYFPVASLLLNLNKPICVGVGAKFRSLGPKAQEQQKKVVVAGCVPQAQPRMDYLKGLSIIGVQQIDRVVEVVDEAVKGHSVRLLGQKKDGGRRLGGARLDLPKIRRNPLIEIISINTGCLNACTYCKTKHARGDLASYPIEELVERARQSFQVLYVAHDAYNARDMGKAPISSGGWGGLLWKQTARGDWLMGEDRGGTNVVEDSYRNKQQTRRTYNSLQIVMLFALLCQS